MPFTPLHMGPGIALKAVMRSRFSLMVFGWSQIVMDVQPLVVMLTNKGELHRFTHTYIGATLLALLSGATGKHLGELGLRIVREPRYLPISWKVSFVSAFIGTYSHVLLDSVMHSDIEPFWPLKLTNHLYGFISIDVLHIFCLVTAIAGWLCFYALERYRSNV